MNFSQPQSEFSGSICSKLDFSDVAFSTNLSSLQKAALMLALNISGSFEGNNGWGNISNNFDEQGLSLGLLNQNLGSGSLQPLLIKIQQRHPALMQKIFSHQHYNSLTAMLLNYQKKLAQNLLNLNRQAEVVSFLDISITLDGVNEDESVLWAKQNLYNGSNFIPQWKSEFMVLAKTPEYINIQVEAAQDYFEKAEEYFIRLKTEQLRSFLMFFDVVVQNGGLYNTDINEYLSFLQSNPGLNETLKLEKILELRLRHVKPQWVNVVKARKQTIIYSRGVVNGTNRQLDTEYCYTAISLLPKRSR
ncbi:MAG: hypothetical protein IPM57_09830 [Oligoflexia bacterium]|nr:hypothetical protein [Oligoflexia bacterium]